MEIRAVLGSPARTALGSFVGRRQEMTRLRTLMSDARLLTITGPGGAGKTRIAEELATALRRSFDGGVAVAYLAAAASERDVVQNVASALAMQAATADELQRQLAEYCGQRSVLLVLDNCEHLADAVAGLAAGLIGASAQVRILATSRRPLHVPGEQIFPLGGLGIEAAVELFRDRARRALPDLELDDAASSYVTRICARLESMPLAVELAAAQVRGIGLAELAERVEREASVLSTRSTLAPERQRTLRRTVAWSHDLMDETQRVLWRRLSVFAGGFTLGAARHVAAIPPIDATGVPELLGDLVDQSMVVFDPAADRYRLIEVLREFAQERLREAGEEALVAERHCAWIAQLVETCDAAWHAADQPRVLDTLDSESANLRAALERCSREHQGRDGLRLATGAFAYWIGRGSLAEGGRWCETFLGRSGDPALEARAHWRTGYLATFCFDFARARQRLDRAEEILDQAGSADDRGAIRVVRAALLLYEHPERCGDARTLADELAADAAVEPTARSWAALVSAIASLVLGDFARCRTTCLAAEGPMRKAGDLWSLERILVFLAHAEWQLGDAAVAEARLLEAITITRAMRDLGHLAWAADTLGWVTVDLGKAERAARLMGIAGAEWIRSGARLAAPLQRYRDTALERSRQALGAARLAAGIEAGRGLDAAPAEAFAFILDGPARAEEGPSADGDLSAREREVVALVAEGLGNREIAERLFLSPRTVEKHVEHVMDKLGLDSRAAIAAWYARSQARP